MSPTLALHVMLFLGGSGILGQGEQPLREVQSGNERYYLQVRPGRPGFDAVRGCKGTLFERAAERQRARECWGRFLVNDVAPARVLIRDDGRYVVTLDEFERGGARHALVIYGPRGELLRHFVLTDLLGRDDWKHVQVRQRAVSWLDQARCAFVPGREEFVIALRPGRELRIDLQRLTLVRSARPALTTDAVDEIPADILAALFSEEPPAAAAIQPPAITRPDGAATAQPPVAQPRSAVAAVAQPPPPVSDVSQPPPAAAQPTGAATAPAAAPVTTRPARGPGRPEHAPRGEGAPPRTPAMDPRRPGPAGDLEVPDPDPVHRVDYLEWVNQHVRTDGPNAGPLYEEAIDRFTAWSGDPELLKAAARGDAVALAAPELQQWLDQNLVAITRFRDATQLDFRGWKLHSEDGSLIGALLTNTAPMRHLAQATVIDGKRLELEGFAPGAVDNYVDALAAGAHVGSGPTLIENLVGQALQATATRALLDLPAGPVADAVDYVDLAARLEEASRPPRPLHEALQMERAMFMDTLQRTYELDPVTGELVLNAQMASVFLNEGSGSDKERRARLWSHMTPQRFDQTVQEANTLYDAVRAATRRPYPQAQAEMTRLESDLDGRPDANPMLKALLPSFARTHFIQTRGEAHRRAATLVANLMAYRQEHGSYPTGLEAFGGREFMLDPFTGRPFVYRSTGDQFTLYSAGGNSADDGGVHDERGETNDLVFWPRPAAPPK